jgi:hypothetical protein
MKKHKVTGSNSKQSFQETVNWLLNSGIRIKGGQNKGAYYGWKNLNSAFYPFIYSEVTGYAITCLSWIYSEIRNIEMLEAAKESSAWIINNLYGDLLVAGYVQDDNFTQKGNLANQIYAFDNGVIIMGLLNLYRLIQDSSILRVAERMTEALLRHFFDGQAITNAVLDSSYRRTNYGERKWSTIPGPYHSKLSFALLGLTKITNNTFYAQVSNSLCDFAIRLRKPNGRFITDRSSDVTFLHPHLYACEGLINSGIIQSNEHHYLNGLCGIRWAVDQINPVTGGLPSDSGGKSTDQSDCTAQLLRLLILCGPQLLKKRLFRNADKLNHIIDKLHLRLLDFFIPTGNDKGGFKYHLNLDSSCSWCTMFAAQALWLWTKRRNYIYQEKRWLEYYI